jgi:hypothetical protein
MTTVEPSARNNPMIKQIRKTLAAVTIIMGSSAIALMLFGSERDGGSITGTATRAAGKVLRAIGNFDPIVIGVAVGVLALVGLAFWVRGR